MSDWGHGMSVGIMTSRSLGMPTFIKVQVGMFCSHAHEQHGALSQTFRQGGTPSLCVPCKVGACRRRQAIKLTKVRWHLFRKVRCGRRGIYQSSPHAKAFELEKRNAHDRIVHKKIAKACGSIWSLGFTLPFQIPQESLLEPRYCPCLVSA